MAYAFRWTAIRTTRSWVLPVTAREATSEASDRCRTYLPIWAGRAWHAGWVTQVDVPADDAPMLEILRFATTSYFGYDRHGGVERLAAIANGTFGTWRAQQELPHSQAEVRAALFFESRRWHHLGQSPDSASETYIRALVTQLRVLSGGSVEADRDSFCWRVRRRLRRTGSA